MELKSTADDVRLDLYLAEYLGQSRGELQKKIKHGLVRVNGEVAKPALRLAQGDHIVLSEAEPLVSAAILPCPVPDFLYEDADIVVLNKPAGCLVHAGQGQENTETLVDYLEQRMPLSTLAGTGRHGIVHRLDQWTEGLMVIAKSDIAYTQLVAQFKAHTVLKRYYAMVLGNPLSDHQTVDQPIKRSNASFTKFVVTSQKDANAKPSTTHVRVLKRFQTKTLIEAQPVTGRTHQIRVHCAFLGHPVVGDSLYGKAKEGQQQLQAFTLGFDHPTKGLRLVFQLPLSDRLG
ncbi:MAG: RluA family pseudouridine synthase [Candidatus Margulisiibacteriota bacterium]